ncbi:MAG: DUF2142 domain-containing protein [Desulfobacteraceae bacterium]|nr:DUF2142 domain-containing protein [Desulfobacteraceae bacterium]
MHWTLFNGQNDRHLKIRLKSKTFLVCYLALFLVLSAGAVFFNAKRTWIDFDLALHSAQGIPAGEFYFDTGNGFNEHETVKFHYFQPCDGQFHHYSIGLPTIYTIRRLRFDPLQDQGVITIKNIVVQKQRPIVFNYAARSDTLIPQNAIHSIDISVKGITITTDGKDPCLILSNHFAPYSALSVEGLLDEPGLNFLVLLTISVLAFFLTLGIVVFLNNFTWFCNIRPEKTFLLLGATFGALLVLFNPPFQAPDEAAHFYRSFQLSEFKIKADKHRKYQSGGYLPKSVAMLPLRAMKAFQQPGQKTMPTLYALIAQPLASHERMFSSFASTAIYCPVPYLPQSMGILLGRQLDFSPLCLMYLGRAFSLAFWIGLVYAALKITPFFKWVFFLLALSPMCLFQASSLSYDGFTNGIAFLYIALILHYTFVKDFLGHKERVFFFLVSALLALSKLAYLPMMLLIGLIPTDKLGGKKVYWSFTAIYVVSCAVLAFSWIWYTSDIYVPYSPNNANPQAQLAFILNNPLEYLCVVANSMKYSGMNVFFRHFIGVLGQLTLMLPNWIYFSYFAALLLVALRDGKEGISLNYGNKLLIVLVLILNIALIFTMLYLSFNAPASDVIIGLQGRYLIPLGPLFFLLWYTTRWQGLKPDWGFVLTSYVVLVLTSTLVILMNRYYLMVI